MNLFGGNKKNKRDISQYESSGEGLSSTQLKIGEWYVRNKQTIKKWIVGILSVWCIITLGGSLVGWVWYYSIDYWDDQELMSRQVASFQNYRQIQPFYAAQNPQVSQTDIFKTGTDKYNLTTDLRNVNKYWAGIVTYKYTYSGGETDLSQVVLLPGKTQAAAIIGVDDQAVTQGSNLIIENINWSNIDPHKIEDVEGYINARLNFKVNTTTFSTEGENLKLTLGIENDSSYSYWEADFFVKLFDGNQLVGVRPVKIEEFTTKQKRGVTLSFVKDNINVTRVQLLPSINIFDPGVYMPPPS